MKAADLRIRNYVTVNNPVGWPKLKNTVMQVVGLSERCDKSFPNSTGSVDLFNTDFSPYYFSQFDEFVEPISLTEDWLVKFEFDKREFFEKSYRGPYACFIKNNVFGNFFYEEGVFEYNLGKKQTKYDAVHKIQNLYFALTGEELTIKP